MAVITHVRESVGRVVSPMRNFFSGLSHFKKHLLINLTIGVLIELGIIYYHDSSFIEGIEDWAFDLLIKIDFGTRDLSVPSHGLLWVDIDQDTHLAWQEPIHIPRDQLLGLLQSVIGATPNTTDTNAPVYPGLLPALVVVDISLDMRGVSETADAELVKYLRDYGDNCGQEKCPVILLPKTLYDFDEHDLPIWRKSRISGLDEVVAGNEKLQWVSPYQELSSDFVVRRWKLWRCAKVIEGNKEEIRVLPSIQMASLIAIREKGLDFNNKMGRVNQWARQDCLSQGGQDGGDDSSGADPEMLALGGIILRGDNSVVGRRIMYSMAQTPSKGVDSPYMRTMQGDLEPALLRYPAQLLLENAEEIPKPKFANRIVLIGGSHADSPDFHMTPLGMMPGALIVANTIVSIVQVGEADSVSKLVKVAVACGLIILMSLCFFKFSSFLGMLISGGVIILVLVPLSFYYFRQGMWLDFALPLLAVQIHEIVAEIEEAISKARSSNHKGNT